MPEQNYQSTSTVYHSTPNGRRPKKLTDAEWQTTDLPLYGLLQGKTIGAEITLIR